MKTVRRFAFVLLLAIHASFGAVQAQDQDQDQAQDQDPVLPRPPPERPAQTPPPPRPPPERTPIPPPALVEQIDSMPAEPTNEPASDPPVLPPEETLPAPEPRPHRTACPAILDRLVVGEPAPEIDQGQCRVRAPWALSAAGGISLPTGFVTDCEMATALADWLAELDRYAHATLETGIEALSGGTGFQCRSRNNAAGARLSEHAYANAFDIMAFRLEDGRVFSVELGWEEEGEEGTFLRHAHALACARFTTVLGPEANALHRDHFHLDLGCHGASCTYRLCE